MDIKDYLFQSPNGVQIAFIATTDNQRDKAVSITKRCTDCFVSLETSAKAE